jgi:predicted nuclease with TOPRIM domain
LASVLASHPLIDIFGIINYPEFDVWEENFDFCNILSNIQYTFSLSPPVPLKEKTFPDFQNIIRSHNISIKKDNDLIKVVKLSEEYKALETVKNEYIDENTKLAEELIRKKQDYLKRVQENSAKIEKYQEVKQKITELEKEVERVQENLHKNVTPNKQREIEHRSQVAANSVLTQFMHKQLGVNDFIENYISLIKDSKKISLIKNKK